MSAADAELSYLSLLDQRIAEAASGIRILAQLSWKKSVQQRFMADWDAGQPRLPEVSYAPVELSAQIAALENLLAEIPLGHPVAEYLSATANSYLEAARMLMARGTHELCTYSISLYGRPGDPLPGSQLSNTDAARHFLEVSAEASRVFAAREADLCIPAHVVQERLEEGLSEVFGPRQIAVVIDPNLVSKAAAGPTRIRLRDATCFSEYDVRQLLEHEAFVHSLTALNGRRQQNLPTLGLGSPRTTGAQEGLATFAELITGAIDIGRMKRISLRILAIDLALNGADFIDVFRFFIEHHSTPMEAFNSAMRVFRGVPTTGGSAFTKDTVYLHGLMAVHTFCRWALKEQRLGLLRHFFAGRMTLQDVISLEPWFESGWIEEPQYLPPWMQRGFGLAGYLSFSVFANRIRLDRVEEDHLVVGGL